MFCSAFRLYSQQLCFSCVFVRSVNTKKQLLLYKKEPISTNETSSEQIYGILDKQNRNDQQPLKGLCSRKCLYFVLRNCLLLFYYIFLDLTIYFDFMKNVEYLKTFLFLLFLRTIVFIGPQLLDFSKKKKFK